jgi:hypothetical protein
VEDSDTELQKTVSDKSLDKILTPTAAMPFV